MTDDRDAGGQRGPRPIPRAVMEQMIEMLFDEMLRGIERDTPDRESYRRLSRRVEELRRLCRRQLSETEDETPRDRED